MCYVKKLLTLVCIFSLSFSFTFSQTNISEKEKQTIIYGTDAQIVQAEPMVTKVMNADMYDYIFAILKDNLWFVIVICICVVLLIYAIILFLSLLIKGILRRFDNSEYIEFGKFKIKNRNYKGRDTSHIKEFDIDKFLCMLELLIETELSSSISKTIDVTNSIHALETNYTHQCEMIFRNTFSSIKNVYYTDILNYIVTVTGFNNSEIHKTKEYFFMDDLLNNVEMLWIDHSKDIISRNGFVEIVEDKKKASNYIDELNELIWQAIDVKKLEVTAINKKDLDDLIISTTKNIQSQLENMFIRLGNLKKNVIEKKENKLKVIDNEIRESIGTLLDQIRIKFLSPNTTTETTNNNNQ